MSAKIPSAHSSFGHNQICLFKSHPLSSEKDDSPDVAPVSVLNVWVIMSFP